MRIALVENGTKEPQLLLDLLAPHDITVFELEDAERVLEGTFDLIVLSGSNRFPIMHNLDVLEPELRLIRETTTPLLGICFGHELIAVAFDGTLIEIPERRQGRHTIQTVKDHALFSGASEFEVYEAHRWSIDFVPEALEVLAQSEDGPEILMHTTRPIVGFQFHPEKLADSSHGPQLFAAFLTSYIS